MKKITIELTESEIEVVIHDLCVDLEACDALFKEHEYSQHDPHKQANAILDKLVAAGATREQFQAWGRRWDECQQTLDA